MAGHPRLWLTAADLPRLRSWATARNPIWRRGLLPVIDKAISVYRSKFAPFYTNHPPSTAYPDPGDTQGYTGYLIEEYGLLLAFDSLIDPSAAQRTQSASWARNMLMYAIDQAAKRPAAGLPFRDPAFPIYNRANGSGEEWPLIVDWIYPSLSGQDKRTIRSVFMLLRAVGPFAVLEELQRRGRRGSSLRTTAIQSRRSAPMRATPMPTAT